MKIEDDEEGGGVKETRKDAKDETAKSGESLKGFPFKTPSSFWKKGLGLILKNG